MPLTRAIGTERAYGNDKYTAMRACQYDCSARAVSELTDAPDAPERLRGFYVRGFVSVTSVRSKGLPFVRALHVCSLFVLCADFKHAPFHMPSEHHPPSIRTDMHT